MNTAEQYNCPYCEKILPKPTRKRQCPSCGKTIFVRTRLNKSKDWVREEDLIPIAKEYADAMIERHDREQREVNEGNLHIARHNIRQYLASEVVKSIIIWSADDDKVCENCKNLHGKSFSLYKDEEMRFAMTNAQVKSCTNPTGCRCYWRPDEIDLNVD